MRAVIQRVAKAAVFIDQQLHEKIDGGICLFLGIAQNDTEADGSWLAEKAANLRIFADANEKMNLSLKDVGKEMLIISQFTLMGDCRKGRRPGFANAAPPALAKPLYHHFIQQIENQGIPAKAGVFQADMQIKLENDGPVTLLLNSP